MVDEDFEGEILEYFQDEYQEYWRNEIRRGEWTGAEELADLLENNKFKEIYGENSKLYMLCDGESLLSFCALVEKDCAENCNFSPAIKFVFTFPSHRNNGYASMLIDQACEDAAGDGAEKVYMATELKEFCEKLGFTQSTENGKQGDIIIFEKNI